jgi:hypothetical protein
MSAIIVLEITCNVCAKVYEVTEIRDGLFSSDADFCLGCGSGNVSVTKFNGRKAPWVIA